MVYTSAFSASSDSLSDLTTPRSHRIGAPLSFLNIISGCPEMHKIFGVVRKSRQDSLNRAYSRRKWNWERAHRTGATFTQWTRREACPSKLRSYFRKISLKVSFLDTRKEHSLGQLRLASDGFSSLMKGQSSLMR